MFGSYSFASIPFASSQLDLSTSPVIPDLIADQESPRAYLLHATPYDPIADTETHVRASIGAKRPIYDGVHWPANLKTAVDSQVDLFGNEEYQQGATSFGNLELLIGNEEHDELTGYYWDGRQVEVLLGAEDFSFDEFKQVLYGTAEDITYGQHKLNIVFRGKEELLDKLVQENLYEGTGGLEGGDDIKGSPKPVVLGFVSNITPVTVDADDLIYQVHDGSIERIPRAFDGAADLRYAGDVTDIETADPDPGFFMTQLSGGYFKLGAPPEKQVTCDVRGDNSGGYVSTVLEIIQRVVLNYTDLTEADLNLPSFFTANLDSRRVEAGVYILNESVIEVMNLLTDSIGGAWTFNRTGLLTIAVFRLRRSAGTITENDVVKDSFRRDRTPPPCWQRRLGFLRSHTVQTNDQTLGAAGAAHKSFVAEEYRYVTDEEAAIKTSHPRARIVEKETALVHRIDAEIEVIRQQLLYGAAFNRYNLIVKRQQFKYQVGQTITIEYSRFGIASDMLILGIRENTSTCQTTFRLWSIASTSAPIDGLQDPLTLAGLIDPASGGPITDPTP